MKMALLGNLYISGPRNPSNRSSPFLSMQISIVLVGRDVLSKNWDTKGPQMTALVSSNKDRNSSGRLNHLATIDRVFHCIDMYSLVRFRIEKFVVDRRNIEEAGQASKNWCTNKKPPRTRMFSNADG